MHYADRRKDSQNVLCSEALIYFTFGDFSFMLPEITINVKLIEENIIRFKFRVAIRPFELTGK
jgi:hypothetical protein